MTEDVSKVMLCLLKALVCIIRTIRRPCTVAYLAFSLAAIANKSLKIMNLPKSIDHARDYKLQTLFLS